MILVSRAHDTPAPSIRRWIASFPVCTLYRRSISFLPPYASASRDWRI